VLQLAWPCEALATNDDTPVKSPFYMDLGIQEFRNCELL